MAEITPDDFLDRVAAGKIPPVVFLYGEEDYKTEECVNAAIAKTLDESSKGFNLDVLYGSKAAAKDVLAIATSFPMMSERRVVVVKEFERLVIGDSARTLVMSYVDRPLESTVLLLAADDPDLRKKPFAELKKKIDAVYCKPLWENQIPPWVFSYVKKHKRNIDDGACHMLAAYVGTSLRALSNEIEKLFIFLGDRTDITVDDVTSVVGATKGFTVFDLQRAVGKKNVKEATTIAQRM
ncbi:MAG: DNA polymerase III subunit delta, partial [Ignavibacteriales bacterium]|nr:DNA polymerase III subunit delta [Ignavibacteriales bacterium]